MERPVRYFEDYGIGDRFDLGTLSLSADEIVEFARRYDPQPFHVDPEAAAQSFYGGLIASGWHTAVVFMRRLVDRVLADTATRGSPGIDEIHFRRPVRPGDRLHASVTLETARVLRSRPEWGLLRLRCVLRSDQNDEVFSMLVNGFVACSTLPSTSGEDAGHPLEGTEQASPC